MNDGMRIGELADHVGVNPKTIRYYESIGVMPPPRRTPSGHRVYDATDHDRLTFIKTAQRLGITLDEIREILALRDRGLRPCGYVREVLRREVADIQQRIAALTRLRDDLIALDQLADQLPETPASTCSLIDHVRNKASEAPTQAPARPLPRPERPAGRTRR